MTDTYISDEMVEAAATHLEIDFDGDEPFIRLDSINAALEAIAPALVRKGMERAAELVQNLHGDMTGPMVAGRIRMLIEESAAIDSVRRETEILQRLAGGDKIVFSEDGDEAWFAGGDRAFVSDAVIEMRKKGYLKRMCDDDENYRGSSEYDTISEAGLAAIRTAAEDV